MVAKGWLVDLNWFKLISNLKVFLDAGPVSHLRAISATMSAYTFVYYT